MSRPTISDAMTSAAAAHAKIDSHEEICAERYKMINDAQAKSYDVQNKILNSLGDLANSQKKDIGDIYKFLWKCAFWVLGGSCAVCAFLIGFVVYLLYGYKG